MEQNTPELNSTQIKQDPIVGNRVEVITHNITLRSNDRSTKDVSTWRKSHTTAESVSNPRRSDLYNVYEDVLLDGHLSGIISKRIDTVLNKRLLFKKGDIPVPEMEPIIKSKAFRDIITAILESKLWGISGLEFQPGANLAFKKIPRKHIKPKWQIITLNEHDQEGISYTDLSNVWIIGDPDDLGLLLKCAFYALLKKGTITDWAEYIEIFGSPIITMKYDAGDVQTERKIDDVLNGIGNTTKIKIPKQAEFTVQDGKASNGDGKLQETFVRVMNGEMSIVVLGNTETTTSSSSSGYAQSKTHSDQQMQIIKSDMCDVLDYLNTPHFLAILASYGLPVDGGMFEYDREVDVNYMQAKIVVDKELHTIGVPFSKKYIYNTYAIDQPTTEEDTLTTATENTSDTPPPPKPKTKPKNLKDDDSAPITRAELKTMLADFFGQAL